jgi:magnesium-transporting ATPase (P-type)
MWNAMRDLLLRVLVVCGIVSAVLGATIGEHKDTGWIEGVAIMAAVVIVVMTTAINDLQQERQFQALKSQQVAIMDFVKIIVFFFYYCQ